MDILNRKSKSVVVVVLLFYGPSTLFVTFRVLSVNLCTLFLGKPPRQSQLQGARLTTALLESAEGREWP